MTPKERLARKIADDRIRREKADPHGFFSMSERELIEWLGAGNAEPGSAAYSQAERVLAVKRREADENARASERTQKFMDDFMDDLAGRGRDWESTKAEKRSASPDHLTQGHLAVLALPFAVFAAVIIPTGSTLWSALAAVIVVGILFIKPVRNRLIQSLSQVAD
jgi:Flp pilus assembly protein TadB